MSILLVLIVAFVTLGVRVRTATVQASTQIVPEQLAVRQLRNGAVDLQTGIRGYVIAGETKFLEPYVRGTAAVRAQKVELKRLMTGDDARQLLAAFGERLVEWQVTADRLVELVRSGDTEAAVELVKTSAGRLAFDRVLDSIDDIESGVNDRADANDRVVRETQSQLLLGAVVLSIVTLLLGWGSAQTIRSWNAKDVTAADDAAAVAVDELAWLASLNAMTEKLNRTETAASVAQVLDEEAAAAFGASGCSVAIIDRYGSLGSARAGSDLATLDHAEALGEAVSAGAYVTFGAARQVAFRSETTRVQPIEPAMSGPGGVAVPLFSGLGYVRGAMSVTWSHPVSIDIAMRSRLDTVAVLCTETMRRAELLDAVTAMAAVSELVANARTNHDVQQIVATRSWEPFGASASTVLIAHGGEFRVFERPDRDGALADRYSSTTSSTVSPAGDAARSGRLALAANVGDYGLAYPDLINQNGDSGIQAELAIPIEVSGRIVAIVVLAWVHAIDAVAVRATAATFATLVAAAWRRAETFRSTTSISKLANRLTSSTTINELSEAFIEFGLPAVGATSGKIAAFDADIDKDRAAVYLSQVGLSAKAGEQSLSIHDPATVIAAIRSGRPVTVQTSTTLIDPQLGIAETGGAPVITTIAIPMRSSSQQLIGAVEFVWDTAQEIDSSRIAFVETIADMCAQTLDRTRLVDQDHRRVTALASRLFGRHTAPSGLDIATRYVPAIVKQFVGGDWFEIVQLGEDRVAAVVGDVVGHGIDAAADMAQLKTLIGTLLRMGVDCDHLFHQIGPLLEHAQTQKVFGTAAVVELRPFASSLNVSTAGHPPALMWRAGQGATLCVGTRYPLLGVPAPLATPGMPHTFEPGSVVVVYTDGLVERRRESLDVGIERIRRTLEDCAHHSVEVIADALIATAADSDHSDDIALVVIRNTVSAPLNV